MKRMSKGGAQTGIPKTPGGGAMPGAKLPKLGMGDTKMPKASKIPSVPKMPKLPKVKGIK